MIRGKGKGKGEGKGEWGYGSFQPLGYLIITASVESGAVLTIPVKTKSRVGLKKCPANRKVLRVCSDTYDGFLW